MVATEALWLLDTSILVDILRGTEIGRIAQSDHKTNTEGGQRAVLLVCVDSVLFLNGINKGYRYEAVDHGQIQPKAQAIIDDRLERNPEWRACGACR